ncbi:gamma-glutamylcyclotransferase [Paragemmobacter ruber]|uniref:glutathione-specific gamma-glutamylcyclotransferase n=1 Tax=Paragemmobacter ruber TaxID=1985673 RepID=A0ABW9Y5J9_9RHOB|nr:gamma-glutamylcyclotransferase [Rhodobacter ruber]NBE07795.1 gamma-glutamylcyclotransferase [Rhodobacter ruber]
MTRGRALHLTEELVARVERQEAEHPGARGLPYIEEEAFGRHAQRLLAEAGEGPVWTFAYGSLIWKPAFEAAEAVPCTLHGWRRSFCIHLESWRGTPQEPGLMLALARGGSCRGMAYRLPDGARAAAMEALLRREIGYEVDLASVRWLTVRGETERGKTGPFRALVFYAAPLDGAIHVDLPLAEQARRIARAAGHVGSCAAYLRNTVQHLEELGIRDRYLWALQRLVAEEISARHGCPV